MTVATTPSGTTPTQTPPAGDTTPATPPGGTTPGGTPTTPQPPAWLPDDLKRETRLHAFADPAALAKAYLARDGAVVIPGKDATPEAVAAFRKALGVPDTPEGYALARNRDTALLDEGAEQALVGKLHAAGAPPAVVQAALDAYDTFLANADRALLTQRQAAETTLKQEWGTEYTAKAAAGQRVIARLGQSYPDLKALFELPWGGQQLGSHPALVRAFALAGEAVGEDRLVTAPTTVGAGAGSEAAALKARYPSMAKEIDGAYGGGR